METFTLHDVDLAKRAIDLIHARLEEAKMKDAVLNSCCNQGHEFSGMMLCSEHDS